MTNPSATILSYFRDKDIPIVVAINNEEQHRFFLDCFGIDAPLKKEKCYASISRGYRVSSPNYGLNHEPNLLTFDEFRFLVDSDKCFDVEKIIGKR
jgi:hypothetical protein